MKETESRNKYQDQQRLQEEEDKDLIMPLSPQSKFVQFIMRNKEITLAYKPTIICLVLGIVTFLSIAIAMLVSMKDTSTLIIQYFQPEGSTCQAQGQNCTVSFNITEQMLPPIFVSYQLDNFYQNQRRFVQSKSNSQLQGSEISQNQAKICNPFVTNADMNVVVSWNGTALDPNAVASPCGAVAKFVFNDTFSLSLQGQTISINESGISWPGDKGGAFRQGPNSSSTQWIDPENEHFIVWMRTAGVPSFKKLWGSISQPLPAGEYQITITANYFITNYLGSKYFVLSTIGNWGGTNYVLPVILILVSLACLMAILYISSIAKTYSKVARHQ